MRLSDVDTWELGGLQNELIHHFMLAADVIGGGIWEFMNKADKPAFLKRELVRLGVDGTSRSEFTTVEVDQCLFTGF